jgi:hypothetical protein
MKKKTRKHCVNKAIEVAKARDKYRCLWCGLGKPQVQIQGSHIKGEGAYPNLSYNPRNIKALCATCHRKWHSSPLDGVKWFSTKHPKWHKEILALAREPVGKHDYNVIFEKLCQELACLQ